MRAQETTYWDRDLIDGLGAILTDDLELRTHPRYPLSLSPNPSPNIHNQSILRQRRPVEACILDQTMLSRQTVPNVPFMFFLCGYKLVHPIITI